MTEIDPASVNRYWTRVKPSVLGPYMPMGCELVKKWKRIALQSLQCLPIIGCDSDWSVRLGNPWSQRLPYALGISFANLENHFFVLDADSAQQSMRTG